MINKQDYLVSYSSVPDYVLPQQIAPLTDNQKRILSILAAANDRGRLKYGSASIETGTPPTGCWKMEVIEELVDAIQYLMVHTQELEARLNA